MAKTVLLTGASGRIGSVLVDLLAAGPEVEVRALVHSEAKALALRDRGIAAAVGDLDDPRTLPAAFEGVDVLWSLTQLDPRAPEHSMNITWAARCAGVPSVVRLSVINAAGTAPTRNARLHALSEQELMGSGMRWTILRPHYFMQNILALAWTISTQGMVYQNMGNGSLGMIDVRDIAAAAAAVIIDPDPHAGRVYTLTGPQSVTFEEVVDTLGAVLGKPLKYVAVPSDAARDSMRQAGLSGWMADALAEYGEAYGSGWGDFTTGDVESITGRPARSLRQFAQDHAAAFASAGR